MERPQKIKLLSEPVKKAVHAGTTVPQVERAVGGQSLSMVAYQHLHDEILAGRLKSGMVLSEAAVAKRLGISRTPVGEAVRQLVREGLLEQVPRFGTVVKSLGRIELIENYEVREAMETYASALAAQRGTREDVERINSLNDVMKHLVDGLEGDDRTPVDSAVLRRFLAADMAFHLAILQAAGNRRFIEIISMSRSVARIFSVQRPRHDVKLIKHAFEFHRSIADAITRGDATSAQEQMLSHLRLSKQQALESLDQSASRGETGLVELPEDVQRDLLALEDSMRRSQVSPSA